MSLSFDPSIRPSEHDFLSTLSSSKLNDVEQCVILSIFENIKNYAEFGKEITATDLTLSTKNAALNAYKCASTLYPASPSNAGSSMTRVVSEKIKQIVGTKDVCYIELHELGLNICFEKGGDNIKCAQELDVSGITPSFDTKVITNNFGTFKQSVVLSTVQDIHQLLSVVCKLSPIQIMGFVAESNLAEDDQMAAELQKFKSIAKQAQMQQLPSLTTATTRSNTTTTAPKPLSKPCCPKPTPPQPLTTKASFLTAVKRTGNPPKGMPTPAAARPLPPPPSIKDAKHFPALPKGPGLKMLPIPTANKLQDQQRKVLESIPEFKELAYQGKGTMSFSIDVYMYKVLSEGYHSVFEFQADAIQYDVQQLIPQMIEILQRPEKDEFRKNAISLLADAFKNDPYEQLSIMTILVQQM